MKILLDECVPRRLKSHLSGHVCTTVPEAGLAGTENGELLASAEALGYDVFLTVDRGLEYQQNRANRKIAIIILCARSNALADLLPLLSACLSHLKAIEPGAVIRIEE